MWKCKIEKVSNGYLLTDYDYMNSSSVYTDFDKLIDAVAMHFNEMKIGEHYKTKTPKE